jgi:type IV secretory pathway VirB6-like protein
MASATAERIRAVLPSSWIIVAFAIWLISRVILALYIAIGPLLIGLALFPATRSIFERWIGSLISCVILQITTIVLLYIVLAVEQQVAGFGTLIDAFWRTSAQANIPSAITRPPRFSNHCAFQPLRV